MSEEQPVQPEIITTGPGDPVAAIVAGVHGDEPSGVRAIERVLEAETAGEIHLERAIKTVVANPSAVAANRRFMEVDMNRSFPGRPDGKLEERIAMTVCEAIADVPTLALHATRSKGTPFAFVPPDDPKAMELASRLSVPNIVLADGAEIGALSSCGSVVTVEAGPQGSDEAAEIAYQLSLEFLQATGAMADAPSPGNPAVFELAGEIDRPPGERYEIEADNFTLVPEGAVFARVDGEPMRAQEPFYPVLLSADGYEEIMGFYGRKVADSIEELA